MVTPTAISKYLSDLRFPATREELIEHAEEHGAPEEVLDAISSIPDGIYDSLADVWAITASRQ